MTVTGNSTGGKESESALERHRNELCSTVLTTQDDRQDSEGK